MFDAMRRNTKLIMWITTAAFVLLIFLAWGAEYQGFGGSKGRQAGVIGRVNSDPIHGMVYQDRINQARANVAQQGQSIDEAMEVQIRDQAWNQLIQEILVDQQIRARGIKVSDKEIIEAIRTQPLPQIMQLPEFQTDGRFDYSKYAAALSDPNRDWVQLESYYRMDLPKQKLQQLVVSSVKVSDADIRRQFEADNLKAKVAFVHVPATRFQVDQAGLEETAIAAYYDSHKDDYRLDRQAWIRSVRIEKKPTAADSMAARETIEQAAKEARDGEAWDLLVSAYSEAPMQLRGGAQGTYMTRTQFSAPAVRDAAFSLPVGQVSGIITESNGFHLIKVEDRRMNNEQEEVKISDIFIPIVLSGDTLVEYRDKAYTIMTASNEAGNDLNAGAGREGLTPTETGPFGRKSFVPRVGQIAGFMDWVFNSPQGKISIMEAPDAWYVVQVSRLREAGVIPLEEIKDRVRSDYANSLQVEQAKAHAERILAMARGTSLEAAARGDSLATFDTTDEFSRRGFARGLGNDPAVLARVFNGDTGLVPGVITTKRGAYLLDILSRSAPDESQFATQKDGIRRQIFQRRRGEVVNRWIEELRAQAKIEDYRGEGEL